MLFYLLRAFFYIDAVQIISKFFRVADVSVGAMESQAGPFYDYYSSGSKTAKEDCQCDRLQRVLYESKMTLAKFRPPGRLPKGGCVIFGQASHGFKQTKTKEQKRNSLYTIPNKHYHGIKESKASTEQTPICLPDVHALAANPPR